MPGGGDTAKTVLIRRQDIAVLLFHHLGFSKLRNLFFRFRNIAGAVFVTFHDIPPEARSNFEGNLHYLRKKTNVVGLDDYFAGRLSSENINVVITFDDGYKSWLDYAVPALKDLNLPATFFVSSGFVGLEEEAEEEFAKSRLQLEPKPGKKMPGCLSPEDLRTIVEGGFIVGGHTVDHCNLAEIRDLRRARYEIMEDRIRLEKWTGSQVKYFSYPFGACSNPEINLVEILKEAGYKGAVSTTTGMNVSRSDPYLLHRELTPANMHRMVFRARASGNYHAISFLKKAKEYL